MAKRVGCGDDRSLGSCRIGKTQIKRKSIVSSSAAPPLSEDKRDGRFLHLQRFSLFEAEQEKVIAPAQKNLHPAKSI